MDAGPGVDVITWLAIVGVALLAFLTFAIGLSMGRRKRAESPPEVGIAGLGDGHSTIRSYIIPKRLATPKAKETPLEEEKLRSRRYSDAAIEIDGGASAGANWPLLKGRTRIGREGDNHVVLDDERVSSHHALISVRDGVYWLEDLGSTNGTFVGDDRRVMAPHPLEDGERFRIGGVVLRFHGE